MGRTCWWETSSHFGWTQLECNWSELKLWPNYMQPEEMCFSYEAEKQEMAVGLNLELKDLSLLTGGNHQTTVRARSIHLCHC